MNFYNFRNLHCVSFAYIDHSKLEGTFVRVSASNWYGLQLHIVCGIQYFALLQVQSILGSLAYMENTLLIHLVQLLVKKSFSQDLFRAKQTSAYIVIMEEYLVRWSLLCQWVVLLGLSLSVIYVTPHHIRFTALFPGPPGWAGARRELLDFMAQGEINRGRHTDHPAGCHSIRTNQCPPPPSPHYVWINYDGNLLVVI